VRIAIIDRNSFDVAAIFRCYLGKEVDLVKPLSGKLIEIYSLCIALILISIIGFTTYHDVWSFDGLPETHVIDWAVYLPGTWEAVDSKGQLHSMTFPRCSVIAPIEFVPANADQVELRQGYRIVIGLQRADESVDGRQDFLIGRGWSTSLGKLGMSNALSIHNANEDRAIVSVPTRVGVVGPDDVRDEIYLERVDESTLRAISQQLVRDQTYESLEFTRVPSPQARPTELSTASCTASH